MMTMKKLLITLLFILPTVIAFSQAGSQSISGSFMRVNDSTAYQSAASAKHSAGYSDIYWNNQAATPHWDIWDGSAYTHVFDFNSGTGGSGSAYTEHVDESGTTLTVNNTHHNKVIHATNASGLEVTLPNTITAGVVISFWRDAGAGEITFIGSGGATLEYFGDAASMVNENIMVSWLKRNSTEWDGTGQIGESGSGGGGGGTWGSITGTLSDQTDLQSALNLKATLASPTFTGTPAAPTASAGTSTTQIATTAFVTTSDNLKGNNALTVSTKTANYTLVSGDLTTIQAGGVLSFLMNVATPNDFNIPTNATVAIPLGTVMWITQYGAGQTTVVPAGGVTLRSALSANKTYAQYSVLRLSKIGTDEWLLTGDMAP